MRKIYLSLLLFVALTSCQSDFEVAQPTLPQQSLPNYNTCSDALPGKLAIRVDEQLAAKIEGAIATRAAANEILTSEDLRSAGITSIRRMFPYAGKFEARTREAGLHLWYNVSFSEDQPNTRVASSFLQLDGVELVEDRVRYHSSDQKPVVVDVAAAKSTRLNDEDDIFDDPYLFLQWHYKNDADVEGFVKGMDINVAPLWASGVTGRPEVVVAIVDGGIDVDHPDLAANIHINEVEMNGEPDVDDDNNGYVDDIYGYNFIKSSGTIIAHDHGTHVAGTVGAVNNNGIGVSGVAGGNGDPNSGVRMISCQMLLTDEATGSDLVGEETTAAEAMKYGADAGAVISQNSWGYQSATLMQYDMDAIDYFVEHAGIDENGNQVGAMKGGIVLVAAGNESASYANPGQYPSAVCVTAISPDGAMAPYSNHGEWADISAPGGEKDRWTLLEGGVMSTVVAGKYENDYGAFNGTSMACPHVSGVVALYLSKCVELGITEGLTPDMVLERLFATTRSLEELEPRYCSLMGNGLIDASRFVGIDTETAPEPVDDLAVIDRTYTSISVGWSVPQNAKGYTIFYSDQPLDGVDYDTAKSLDVNKIVGDDGKLQATITNLDPETKYYFAIRSWDYADHTSEVSASIAATTLQNFAPQFFRDDILVEDRDVIELAPDGQIKLTYKILDPEGVVCDYEFKSGSAAESAPIYNLSAQTLTIYVVASKVGFGTYSCSISATDDFNATTTIDVEYTISENYPPKVVAQIADIELKELGVATQLSVVEVFEDDDLPLAYSVESSNKDVATAVIVDDTTLKITPKSYGITTISLTATDKLGAQGICKFNVVCKSENGEYSILLYPNPVSSTLNIKSDAPIVDRLDFYNSRGVKVKSVNDIGATRSFDVSKLNSGVYSVDVVVDGRSNIKQITKL